MVLRIAEDGAIFQEPPYTQAEQDAFWKGLSHGVRSFSRPAAPAAAHRSQHRRQSHRPGLQSPTQTDQPARRLDLARVLDSLVDRRAALRVDPHLLQDPAWLVTSPLRTKA
jgi:hypothetical protein